MLGCIIVPIFCLSTGGGLCVVKNSLCTPLNTLLISKQNTGFVFFEKFFFFSDLQRFVMIAMNKISLLLIALYFEFPVSFLKNNCALSFICTKTPLTWSYIMCLGF